MSEDNVIEVGPMPGAHWVENVGMVKDETPEPQPEPPAMARHASLGEFLETAEEEKRPDRRTIVFRSGGMEVELPLDEIFYGRPAPQETEARHTSRKARQWTCGNCGQKTDMSDDAAENHHAAQRHKLECPKFAQAQLEQRALIELDETDRARLAAADTLQLSPPAEILLPVRISKWIRIKNAVLRWLRRK